MRKYVCDICRCEVEPRAIAMHNIIPREVAEEAGIWDAVTVKLCNKCLSELEAWYLDKVSDTTYDWGIQGFRPKSPTEMVKEYKAAYTAFVNYKKQSQTDS